MWKRRAAALCAGAAKCLSRGRLVHRVAEDPDPTVRIACAQSLREFGNEQGAAWALVAALGDGDARVREHAAASFDGFCGGIIGGFPIGRRAGGLRPFTRQKRQGGVERHDQTVGGLPRAPPPARLWGVYLRCPS